MRQVPVALQNPQAVIAMPDMEQVPLLMDALEFALEQRGSDVYPQDQVEQNVKALQWHLGAISHRLKLRLRDEGAWRDLSDSRWPSNFTGADVDRVYSSGVYPPILLVWPPEDDSWTELDKPTRHRLHQELAHWGNTPAGRSTLSEKEIEHFIEVISAAQEATDETRRTRLDFEMSKQCDEVAAADAWRWEEPRQE